MPEADHQPDPAPLPPTWLVSPWADIRAALATDDRVVVVLDDDPTGTQTVHGVAVLTTWGSDALTAELTAAAKGPRCFFVLTNSRSLTRTAAVDLARELGANLRQAMQMSGHQTVVISRSDSTLRGHFPAEVDALMESLHQPFDAIVLTPWFLDGGRITQGGVHYARVADQLVPVADTEFARDASFGYTHSYLPEWVEEKTAGAIRADQVGVVTLAEIRGGGPGAVASWLRDRPAGGCVVFDAVEERDVEVVVAGLLQAEAAGRRYLYRSAASLVRVRAGIEPRPLLDPSTLGNPGNPGNSGLDGSGGAPGPSGGHGPGRLMVVGSHVARSTEQLVHLLDNGGDLHVVEVGTDAALADPTAEAGRCAAEVDHALAAGYDVVLHTERTLRTGADSDASLAISARISEVVVAAVALLTTRPRLLVAKGGITSSDVATKALGIRRAEVLGQVQAGVPVWRCGPETRFPGLAYVVFPGNVGQVDSLTQLLASRTGAR